jgi:hypothetical protein
VRASRRRSIYLKPVFCRAVASARDVDVVDVVELAEEWAREVLDEGMSARRQGVVESADTLDEEGLDGIDRVSVLVVEPELRLGVDDRRLE